MTTPDDTTAAPDRAIEEEPDRFMHEETTTSYGLRVELSDEIAKRMLDLAALVVGHRLTKWEKLWDKIAPEVVRLAEQVMPEFVAKGASADTTDPTEHVVAGLGEGVADAVRAALRPLTYKKRWAVARMVSAVPREHARRVFETLLAMINEPRESGPSTEPRESGTEEP